MRNPFRPPLLTLWHAGRALLPLRADGMRRTVSPFQAAMVALALVGGAFALVLLGHGHVAGFIAMLALAGLAAVMPFLAKRPAGQTPDRTRSDLLASLVGAVVRYGPDGTPAHISGSAATLLACQPYELSGTGLFERVHIMDRPAYRKAIDDVASKGGRRTIEIRLRRDDPEGHANPYFWAEMALAADTDGLRAGAPFDVLAVLRDMTPAKRAREQLRKARAEVEESAFAKTRFLATIGHELRTPLNAIVGFSDMMVEGIGGELSATHKDYAGHIRRSGHHLLDVVNMLLDMSRIEAGKFELQAEAFSPCALVDPCLRMVENLGRDRDIVVETQIAPRMPLIVGDERACRQIVINLLSNAIKFSHAHGRVALSLKRQGSMLDISVTDTGIGMQPETVRRIGEPFLQAETGLARRYEGTGLGLSIVKGLVSLHGGRLSILSEPGVGTTVSVLLPLDGPQAARPETPRITHLPMDPRDSDAQKWHQDEKRSAAR